MWSLYSFWCQEEAVLDISHQDVDVVNNDSFPINDQIFILIIIYVSAAYSF